MKTLFVRFTAHALRVISLGALCVILGALGTQPLAHAATTGLPQASSTTAYAPLAGLFIVNSTADNNNADSYLTLREAIMLSYGGNGFSGLNRALTDGEINQLAGCSFSGSTNNWTIVAGTCGPGVYDSITFASSLGVNPVIHLTMYLPDIQDTQPTFLNGVRSIQSSMRVVYLVVNQGLRSGNLMGTPWKTFPSGIVLAMASG